MGDDAAPAERVDELVEVSAREVPLAELGALDGELVAIAALRPGEDPDLLATAAEAEEDPDAALPGDEEEIVDAPVPAASADTLGQGSFDFDGGPRGPL